jgi:hypothetical protein
MQPRWAMPWRAGTTIAGRVGTHPIVASTFT